MNGRKLCLDEIREVFRLVPMADLSPGRTNSFAWRRSSPLSVTTEGSGGDDARQLAQVRPFIGPMRLKESHENGVVIFALSGAIDLHYAPTLRALFQSKLNKHCPALVVDLTAVDFIDSTGLATLIEYHRDAAAHGGVFSLAGVNPNLKAIFDVVQFEKVLAIFPTVAEAKSAITGGEVPPYMADESASG
jgi:anti-sigma B factor antagonist